ncbi:MAG: hypothetical protein IID17_07010 [Nitrospinae bacterium]|nr:hypothetical protein [Nitrospinota bacterium]
MVYQKRLMRMILKSLAWIFRRTVKRFPGKHFIKSVTLGYNCGSVEDILKISRLVEFPG